MNEIYLPTQIERKCLQQLDTPNSWKVLGIDPPDEADVLPWKSFRVVFFFNLALFAFVLLGLFVLLESMVDSSGIREDAPYGVTISLALAVALGGYTTHLYRHSWNRRARWLKRQYDR